MLLCLELVSAEVLDVFRFSGRRKLSLTQFLIWKRSDVVGKATLIPSREFREHAEGERKIEREREERRACLDVAKHVGLDGGEGNRAHDV